MKLVISKSSDCSESLNVHNVDDKTDVDINLRRNSLCRNEVNIDNFYNGDWLKLLIDFRITPSSDTGSYFFILT